MYREGSRLQYLALIPRIVDEEGPLAFEEKVTDVFLKEVNKNGGINEQLRKKNMLAVISKQGSFRYCLKVAEILGLIKLEGTSKGRIRRQIIRNTSFGRSVYLSNKLFHFYIDNILTPAQKLLFLKKFFDFEKEWKGGWIFYLLEICNYNGSWIEETELINTFSDNFAFFKTLSPRSRHHRIFPRIQWLYDLDFLIVDHNGRNRYYQISQKGKEALGLWRKQSYNISFDEISKIYYKIFDEVNVTNTNFKEEISDLYIKIKEQIPIDKLPSISIEVLYNLLIIKKASQGYIMRFEYFLDELHKLHLKGVLNLLTSPSNRMEGVLINNTVYKLVQLKNE